MHDEYKPVIYLAVYQMNPCRNGKKYFSKLMRVVLNSSHCKTIDVIE